ncbi:UV DNA damage repair endonuclease UvsE [Haloquadratum walsbyi]|jgi:UV DNA damage endonuclease|uniref:UV DNA damage endonuclease n=3 Tax=Halobacteriales TaxID=2235 RepID=Q18IN1_HALWD|nr:UV DNA damage repair endonuclease UvsE [Haloquadratum walsbyi]ABQ75972.1 UV DNA damage endonuclease [uncultured haloarchaeon]CAJ52138.1 UV DNA damage endonuclease [Haloquadratum walsbyi DSM 16790]
MLGYAGRNNTLRDHQPPVRCNRGMQKKTWEDKGLPYAGELAEQNFRDLLTILQWNYEHDIGFYRCTSQSFVPWNSQYNIESLPNIDTIREIAEQCGEFIQDHDMRLSFHPDYFVKPASTTRSTREKARKSLENHGSWLDLMGLPQTNEYPINIHIGGHYGDKASTADRFIEFMKTVSSSVADRLVIENDDSPNLWSVTELVESISTVTDCPITFDYHHHSFSTDGTTYREAFALAADTWGVCPVTHYSEPAILHAENADRPQTHASYVDRVPSWLHTQADVMIECDGKELAVNQVQTTT